MLTIATPLLPCGRHIFPPKFMSLFVYQFPLSSVSSAHMSMGMESPMGHRELISGQADEEKEFSLLCFHFVAVACLRQSLSLAWNLLIPLCRPVSLRDPPASAS